MRAPLVIVALALAASACNNSSSSSPTTPTTPKTTDTLTGTVQVKGSSFGPFTVSSTGEVDVTLTAAGPS
jgi:ABC-type phosphate transport system substrate-binding protein